MRWDWRHAWELLMEQLAAIFVSFERASFCDDYERYRSYEA